MKFESGKRRKAIEYEKDLVQYWKEHKTFEKSVESRPKDNQYVFYDGPPFITGVPHTGTLLATIAKDVVPRYWTMQGKRVERVWGWDCHGLPAEVFTEKKLGIQDRRDIGTKISLEEYINTCRENMVQTGNLWEDTIDRIGRWVDFAGAYKTMDKNYMESVWWAFKTLYEKGKIYEGERVLLYCTRDATPLSKAEVTMDAGSYKDVSDPSVFVKFKLTDSSFLQPQSDSAGTRLAAHDEDAVSHRPASQVPENISEAAPVPDVFLLAWTTTPWTLPANTAVGVGENEIYAEVQMENGDHLILLHSLVAKVLTDEKHQTVKYEVLRTDIKGSEFIGQDYEPLLGVNRGENAHKIWNYPGLSTEEGTGIVHLAPAYGEEDYNLSKEMGFPFVSVIDDNGFYNEGEWQGQNVWEANKPIAKSLLERGVVWKIDYIMHSYPHCYRCGTRLMYRAHPSWFVDIGGQRQLMLEENENIHWFPEHIKHGRFQKTVESAPDWNISRDRFWATAMPVWKGVDADGNTRDNNGNEYIKIIGSYAELKELSGDELADYHRPWVDDITFDIDGVHYTRIDKVMDCWFESGSMPFAQLHYPFENKEKFEATFPGDFIVEYVGQVRAWFYYVHVVNTALFGHNAYKNVITTGTMSGNDGRKMSKSFGNYTDPNILMDTYSADSLRLLLMSSTLMNAEDYALQDKDVGDMARKLGMVWNMYDFFTLYAEVDGWESPPLDARKAISAPQNLTNPLDTWIVARLHQLIAEVEHNMNEYDVPNAVKPILPFLDDASNWYVRRSRRRFWKSEDDNDKNDAYRTLHYVLLQLSMLMAPFTPFLAEELFLKLTGGEAGESVHLLDWPKVGNIDETILKDMQVVREAINDGLAKRAFEKVKVRQPLQSANVKNTFSFSHSSDLTDFYKDIVAEELNVKEVTFDAADETNVSTKTASVELDFNITPQLRREGLMREVVRQVQSARKQAGLNVDDRIRLELDTHDAELKQAIEEHAETIKAETLATDLNTSGNALAEGYKATVPVDDTELALALLKM